LSQRTPSFFKAGCKDKRDFLSAKSFCIDFQ